MRSIEIRQQVSENGRVEVIVVSRELRDTYKPLPKNLGTEQVDHPVGHGDDLSGGLMRAETRITMIATSATEPTVAR